VGFSMLGCARRHPARALSLFYCAANSEMESAEA
jgi:hypothetical protein